MSQAYSAAMTHYNYREGAAVLAAAGHVRAFGTRILARAIMRSDAYSLISVVEYNSAQAEAFEVIHVGGGVAEACRKLGEEPIRIGEHVEIKSTAADRVGPDPTGRFWLVELEDIAGRWMPVPADDPRLTAAIAAAAASSMPGK